MVTAENNKGERVGLEKLKAYLDRSNLEYTEERKGNSTVLEIKRKPKWEEAGEQVKEGNRKEDASL